MLRQISGSLGCQLLGWCSFSGERYSPAGFALALRKVHAIVLALHCLKMFAASAWVDWVHADCGVRVAVMSRARRLSPLLLRVELCGLSA